MSGTLREAIYRFYGSNKHRGLWDRLYRLIQPITKASILARSPALFFFYARHFKPGDFWILPDEQTDLLIEAPGHCATHSFVAYVQKHNPNLRISHTCEVSATVKYCLARNIPVIVLTRNVMDYVRSATTRFSMISRSNALRCYTAFYKDVLPLREHLVVADFPEVIHHPREVLERLNEKYGLELNTGDDELPWIRRLQDHGTEEKAGTVEQQN